jgi:hypothetical protein
MIYVLACVLLLVYPVITADAGDISGYIEYSLINVSGISI